MRRTAPLLRVVAHLRPGLLPPVARHHGRVHDERQPLRGPAHERPAPPAHGTADPRPRRTPFPCSFLRAAGAQRTGEGLDPRRCAANESSRYLSAVEFLEYLNVKQVFPKPPNVFRVTQLLEQLVDAGILTRVTVARDSGIKMTGITPGRYMFTGMVDGHRAGFRVVSVLGPEFLHRLCAPVVGSPCRERRQGRSGRRDRARPSLLFPERKRRKNPHQTPSTQTINCP